MLYATDSNNRLPRVQLEVRLTPGETKQNATDFTDCIEMRSNILVAIHREWTRINANE